MLFIAINVYNYMIKCIAHQPFAIVIDEAIVIACSIVHVSELALLFVIFECVINQMILLSLVMQRLTNVLTITLC